MQQALVDCLDKKPAVIEDISTSSEPQQVLFDPDLKILVVDDNEINLRLAEIILKKNNYDVTTICSGDESIDLARNNNFDLIFMDLHMPGLDGYEATKRIRQNETPSHRAVIIALTANALPQDIDKTESCGMDDVLIKPISEQLVCDTISKWFTRTVLETENEEPAASTTESAEIFSLDNARKLTNGNESLAIELFNMLIKELPGHSEGIKQAIANNDMLLLKDVTHKLNGASRCCGTPALRKAANSLEALIAGGSDEEIKASTGDLLKEIDRLLAYKLPLDLKKSG